MRWIVGDLQGCAREFEALLKKIDFDAERDEIWCAGDLVNRGPDSLAALRLWRSVGGKAVLGNHEVYALSVHAGNWPRKEDTLQELFDAPDADELMAELRALPVLVHLPNDAGPDHWLVHAGLRSDWTDLHAVAARLNAGERDQAWLERPALKFATRVRCVDAEGDMTRFPGKPEARPAGSEPWDTKRVSAPDDDSWVVHGHWAWRGHYINPHQRVVGLDSGCVYGGPLTAWCVESARVVQVEKQGK